MKNSSHLNCTMETYDKSLHKLEICLRWLIHFFYAIHFVQLPLCLSTVATSTSQHNLHSNWVLRDPRRISTDESRLKRAELGSDEGAWRKSAGGTTSSMRRLQRNPIHLPKVVETALQTLRFKPKLTKKD